MMYVVYVHTSRWSVGQMSIHHTVITEASDKSLCIGLCQ